MNLSGYCPSLQCGLQPVSIPWHTDRFFIDAQLPTKMHHTVSTPIPGWQSQWVNGTNGHISESDTLRVCETGQFIIQYTHISSSCPGAFDTIIVEADTMLEKPEIHWQLQHTSPCDSAIYLLTTSNNPVQQYQWVAGNTHSNNGLLVVAGPVEVKLKTINP